SRASAGCLAQRRPRRPSEQSDEDALSEKDGGRHSGDLKQTSDSFLSLPFGSAERNTESPQRQDLLVDRFRQDVAHGVRGTCVPRRRQRLGRYAWWPVFGVHRGFRDLVPLLHKQEPAESETTQNVSSGASGESRPIRDHNRPNTVEHRGLASTRRQDKPAS